MARQGNNEKCACGSGKKFKKCCRDKDQRDWYTCHFCGASEKDTKGREAVLKETDEKIWACEKCIDDRQEPSSFTDVLPLILLSTFGKKMFF